MKSLSLTVAGDLRASFDLEHGESGSALNERVECGVGQLLHKIQIEFSQRSADARVCERLVDNLVAVAEIEVAQTRRVGEQQRDQPVVAVAVRYVQVGQAAHRLEFHARHILLVSRQRVESRI